MIEIQRCNDKGQWDEYILEEGGHPLQLWGWGQVKAGHGWTVERLCVYENDEQVAALQVLIRKLPYPFRSIAYVPRGPVGEAKYFDQALNMAADLVKRDYKSVALTVEPNSREMNLPEGWVVSQNHILQDETILLDLTKSESELLAVMAKKTRQYIRKSASEGIEIRRVRSNDDINECLHIYQQTAERAGFNTHNDQYYRDVYHQLGEYSPIFAAYLDGQPIAFLWMAISTETAYELYGGMNDDGQRLRANYALKWHVIRKAKEWGLSQYDFGGLVAGGVSNFKQGWTDEATRFVGTYDRPLSPLYDLWTKTLPKAKKALQRLRRR